MAGDWIKIREDIHEDPAVLQMASRLKTRPEHVVGYCVRFWSWVSRNCHAGSVTNVTLLSLESVINLPGFCELLCEVGWLEYDENSDGTCTIRIPKFERHLSQGAKNRVLTNERQRKKRVTEMSRSQRDKSVTREEKRREENTTPISSSSTFKRPNVLEVAVFCNESKLKFDPQEFCDYYEAQGWRLSNGNAMKDWHAAARRWERNRKADQPKEEIYA